MANHSGSLHLSRSPNGLLADQVELIWQMGLASLLSNNNEIVIPEHIGDTLNQNSIEGLRQRLSLHFNGAPTILYRDVESKVYRISLFPDVSISRDTSSAHTSPAYPANSPGSTTSTQEALSSNLLRSPGKKSKIRRPPNAFILYRKKHHPILKQKRPTMHNNEISVALGKQWKAEPESVKAEYRTLAERIKKQHAADNPGYQYAPRKPSEKKRRMTARKLAQLRAAELEDESNEYPAIDMLEVADHERSESEGAILMDNSSNEDILNTSGAASTYATSLIGVERPPSMGILGHSISDTVSITLPGADAVLQEQLAAHNTGIDPRDTMQFSATNRTQIAATPAQHVINDQDFLRSIIDWDGIQADMAFIRSTTSEEMKELARISLGNPNLSLSDEAMRISFQEELDRTLRMFQ